MGQRLGAGRISLGAQILQELNLRNAVTIDSIWLRSMGRLRDLLLSLFEHRKGLIEGFSESDCCSGTATQVRCDHDVDLDTFAFWQKRVCRQLDLNSAVVNAECRNAIEVNERCERGASRGHSKPWS